MIIMGFLKYIWTEEFCDLELIFQILAFPFFAILSIIPIPLIWLEFITIDFIIISALYITGNDIRDFYDFCWWGEY